MVASTIESAGTLHHRGFNQFHPSSFTVTISHLIFINPSKMEIDYARLITNDQSALEIHIRYLSFPNQRTQTAQAYLKHHHCNSS